MTEPVIYKLKAPILWDNIEIKEISVKPPKGKHIKKLGGSSNLGDVMGIAHHVTDYTDRFFDELEAKDYLGVSEVIGDFLVDGP